METQMRVALFRGSHLESEHRVYSAFVSEGKPWGLPSHWKSAGLSRGIFPRSAVKFFQAIPLIESGAAEAFGLEALHLALACASHVGAPIHTSAVEEWLSRIGLNLNCLHCGVHEPVDRESSHALVRSNQAPSSLHHNCSGKHTGVLTTCVHLGEPVETYERLDHPAQQRIRKIFELFSGESLDAHSFAVDGCSMPAVRLPLYALARAGARWAGLAEGKLNSSALSGFEGATRALLNAIRTYPEYMGGGLRVCSQMIRVTNGRVVAKTGAEGVFLVMIPEEARAFALKAEDGNMRAVHFALIEILSALGYLDEKMRGQFETFLLAQTFDFHHHVNSELKIQF